MTAPQWVYKETVLALQEQLLLEFGGVPGMRDAGLLESALARPMQLLNYGKPDYFDLAACYAYGLVKNHPFLDGNKRVGFAVSIIFLRANGYRVIATETDAILRTLALATGKLSETGYAGWLRKVTVKNRRGK